MHIAASMCDVLLCGRWWPTGGRGSGPCLSACSGWVSGSPSSRWCLLTITADILQPTINTTPFRFRSAAGGSLHDSISTRRMGRLPSPAQAFAMPRGVRGRLRSNAQTQSIQMQMAHRKRPIYCLRSFETAMLMHEGFLIHVMDALSDWAVTLIERRRNIVYDAESWLCSNSNSSVLDVFLPILFWWCLSFDLFDLGITYTRMRTAWFTRLIIQTVYSISSNRLFKYNIPLEYIIYLIWIDVNIKQTNKRFMKRYPLPKGKMIVGGGDISPTINGWTHVRDGDGPNNSSTWSRRSSFPWWLILFYFKLQSDDHDESIRISRFPYFL